MGVTRFTTFRHSTWLRTLLYALVLSITYLPSLSNSAFTIDDESLIQIPQLKAPLSPSLVKTIFTPGTHIDFYPIRDVAYWIQIHVFHADPLCLDMTIYHIFSIGLFFAILFYMGRIFERRIHSHFAIALMMALFAFLPFHAEMLMWASAQKDLLAILFGIMGVNQIDHWFLSESGARQSDWWKAIGFFLLSFMSKASLVLLPPVIFWGFWFRSFQLKPNKRRVALAYSTALTGLAVAWSILQSRIYEDVNDMRFLYPLPYRLQASLAALGREFLGIFNPNLNIVDVENWGTWLRDNSHFVPVGFAILAIAVTSGIYALIKKNKVILLSLAALAALYLPTSGLIFEHRNFYSTRYLEPALTFGYILLCCAVAKIQISRHWKPIAAAASIIIVSLLFFSSKEAEAWSSSRSVIEKSLSRHPDRISLKAYLLTTLRQENQWGRLTPVEVTQLKSLETEIADRCGLASNSREPDIQEERDDCMWTWMEVVLNPKNRGTEKFQKAASYLQAARARLLPQKVKQLELRTEILEASYGLRSLLSVDPETLVQVSGWGVMPQGRARIISALCLTGHIPEATLLYENYRSEHLIDKESVNEAVSSVSKKNWEAFKTLQTCFEVSSLDR